jgi:flagellar hook-basal body complex protein FliE
MMDPLGLIRSAGGAEPAKASPASGAAQGPTFKDVLRQSIEQVNRLQLDAERAIEDLATGRRDDVTSVMIAKNKADVAFQLMVEVRNKLTDAYEEIKQMRV